MATEAPGESLLVCAPNWLGDAIMAMPAIRALCRKRPTPMVTLLCKPALTSLWELFSEPVRIISLQNGWGGTLQTVRCLRRQRFRHAFIFPNSFRSAWLPFAAGVPVRRGFSGHWRRSLLTAIVVPPVTANAQPVHQELEYAAIANVRLETDHEPLLTVAEERKIKVAGRWGKRLSGPTLLLFPGAARGSSKRWPTDSFAALGCRWIDCTGGSVVIAGTAAESGLGALVARGIGDAALDLTGATSLPELAALIELCSVVVANDSGGAHLAAALGCPVVTIFGQTDPAITGPRGRTVRILSAPASAPARRIARVAPDARALLAALPVDKVLQTAVAAMAESRRQTL